MMTETEPNTDAVRTRDARLRQRRNNFDLLRLIAAGQVIYHHSALFLDVEGRGFLSLLHYLAAIFPGVPIFFVISGFLVSQSYENSASVGVYVRKRALRIFPALWVCFAVTLALLSAFYVLERVTSLPVAVGGEAFLVSWLFPVWAVGQLTVGQFFHPTALSGFGVGHTNPSLWTIPVEIGFYVWVPFMYWLIVKRFRPRLSSAMLAGIALLSFVVWYFVSFAARGIGAARDLLEPDVYFAPVPRSVWILDQTPLPHLYWFVIGVLLWRYHRAIRIFVRDCVLLWTAGYLVLAYAPIQFGAEWIQATFAYQLARAVVLALWVLSFALSFRGASYRLLRGFDLSYGLYLFHMLVINALVELGFGGSGGWILLVYLVTALLAAMSWKLIEQPALSRKHRGSGHRPRPSSRTSRWRHPQETSQDAAEHLTPRRSAP